MHIPDDPLYHEKFTSPPAISDFGRGTHAARSAVCVCWDQWYPEAARLTAGAAQKLFFIQRQSVDSQKKEFGKAQHSAWELIQRGHAIANGCYVAVSNRIGHEAPGGDGIDFGAKVSCGADGEMIAKARLIEKRLWRRRSIGLVLTSSERTGHFARPQNRRLRRDQSTFNRLKALAAASSFKTQAQTGYGIDAHVLECGHCRAALDKANLRNPVNVKRVLF